MSGIYARLFTSTLLLLSLPVKAFGLNTTISKEVTDPSWVQSSLLTEPDLTETRYPKLSPEDLVSPYRSAETVLVLADTFETEFALAEEVSVLFPQSVVFKTSLSCPPELENTQRGRIVSMRVDNRRNFGFFKSDQFDVITMKNGFCCCKGPKETCGGVGMEQDRVFSFFSEVIRVLNKSNPNAVAFLQGSQMAFVGRPNDSMEQEERNQQIIQHQLLLLEDKYPEIEAEMFYKSVSGRHALLKFRASDSIITKLTNGNLEHPVKYLDGIFIRVKKPAPIPNQGSL